MTFENGHVAVMAGAHGGSLRTRASADVLKQRNSMARHCLHSSMRSFNCRTSVRICSTRSVERCLTTKCSVKPSKVETGFSKDPRAGTILSSCNDDADNNWHVHWIRRSESSGLDGLSCLTVRYRSWGSRARLVGGDKSWTRSINQQGSIRV